MNATKLSQRDRLARWGIAALTATLALGPTAAWAEHGKVRVVRPRPQWIPAVYETRPQQITIPAEYETRERRVWREPVYETRRVPVETPADVRVERVARYASCGGIEGYDTVERVIRPARTEWRNEQVLVEPGRFETVYEQVLVRPATTEVTYDRVLVRPGYWTNPGYVAVGKAPRYGSRQGHNEHPRRRGPDRTLRVSMRFDR